MQLSAYLSGPTEYGLHVNAHVSLWLESWSYDKKPSLVQALGFVIVTEEIHKEFDAFVTSMPLLSKGCYFQCGPLLQYWNTHMRPISASVASLFADEYLYLHYSEVDDLCEWVLNTREAFEKHTQSAENPFEHPVESELEEKGIITKCKCSSRTPKLWMTCGELKLYEADRYFMRNNMLACNDFDIFILCSCRVVLESNQSWLNDNIINATQTLLKTEYGTPGLLNTLLTTALQGCVVGGEEFVQVLHSGGNHWLTVSTIGCPYSAVNIYDSMCCTLPHSTQKMICALLVSHEPNVTLRFIDVDRQNDCGLYALAFASTLCSGKDPRHITFSKTDLRKHLLQCLMQNEMEPFPGEKLRRKKMVKETMILEICRSTQDGNMVDCDICKEWFHQSCITVPQNVWEKLSAPGCVFHARKSNPHACHHL